MKSWGFTDAKATMGGAHGGIDVRASAALAQVKWRGGVVGRPDLQKPFGARGSDTTKALFFAASGYSQHAIQYADQHGIGLLTYDPLGKVEAVNLATSGMRRGVVTRPAWWRREDVVWLGGAGAGGCGGVLLMVALTLSR